MRRIMNQPQWEHLLAATAWRAWFESQQLAERLALRELGLDFCRQVMNVDRLPVEHRSPSRRIRD